MEHRRAGVQRCSEHNGSGRRRRRQTGRLRPHDKALKFGARRLLLRIRLTLMGTTQRAVEAAQLLDRVAPTLDEALKGALEEMHRQPMDVAQRRDIEKRLQGIGEAWKEVLAAIKEIAKLSESAAKDDRLLRARIVELEGELREWQEEYEPDTDPNRPPMFSNVRAAIRAFRR